MALLIIHNRYIIEEPELISIIFRYLRVEYKATIKKLRDDGYATTYNVMAKELPKGAEYITLQVEVLVDKVLMISILNN